MFLRTPPKSRASESKNNRTILPSFGGREWWEYSQETLVVKKFFQWQAIPSNPEEENELSFSRRQEGGGGKSMTYMKSSTNSLPHWYTKLKLFSTSVENPGLQLSSTGTVIAGRLVSTEPSSWLYFSSYLILILYCAHHHSMWIHTNAML